MLSQRSHQFSEQIRSKYAGIRNTMATASDIVGELASRDLTLTINSRGRMDELMGEMEKINQEVASELQQVSSFSEEINAGVNMALCSLQFEDMTNQLIGHMEKRLDAIGGFGCASAQLRKDFDVVPGEQLEEQFEQHVEYLQASMEATRQMSGATQKSPVHQEDMDSGDIEFF